MLGFLQIITNMSVSLDIPWPQTFLTLVRYLSGTLGVTSSQRWHPQKNNMFLQIIVHVSPHIATI
jgi:hypothetical protein